MGFGIPAFIRLSSFLVAIGLGLGVGIWIPSGEGAGSLFTAPFFAMIAFVISIPVVSVFLYASSTSDHLSRTYLFLQSIPWWKGFASCIAFGFAAGVIGGLAFHPHFQLDL